MKKEKKQLMKMFKVVVADLLDNYESYTEEERNQIKEIFQKVASLNNILDKYDIEKENFWKEYCDLVGKCFTDVNMLF